MNAMVDAITIGVTDMKRARQFYEHGLAYPVEQDHGEFVTLGLGADASALALYEWEVLADDAGVPAASAATT